MPTDENQPSGAAPQPSPDFQTKVYNELRALAAVHMKGERSDHTLEPTALVHEAWMRLDRSDAADPKNRSQFFHAAAESMRRILIEHARGRKRLKRGGGREKSRLPMNLADLAASEDPARILTVDEAIQRMTDDDPKAGAVVRLRFFAGLTVAETAQTLGLSESTVQREWTYARARLQQLLDD